MGKNFNAYSDISSCEKHKNLNCEKTENFTYYKKNKCEMVTNLKTTPIITTLKSSIYDKKSNYDKTQKQTLWKSTKSCIVRIVTKLKNINCDKAKKSWIVQIVTKLKNTNCYKIQIL